LRAVAVAYLAVMTAAIQVSLPECVHSTRDDTSIASSSSRDDVQSERIAYATPRSGIRTDRVTAGSAPCGTRLGSNTS
jgi:hypothetical protein